MWETTSEVSRNPYTEIFRVDGIGAWLEMAYSSWILIEFSTLMFRKFPARKSFGQTGEEARVEMAFSIEFFDFWDRYYDSHVWKVSTQSDSNIFHAKEVENVKFYSKDIRVRNFRTSAMVPKLILVLSLKQDFWVEKSHMAQELLLTFKTFLAIFHTPALWQKLCNQYS